MREIISIIRLLKDTGRFSFGIYLVHVFFIIVLTKILEPFNITFSDWIYYPIIFLCVSILSYLTCKIISFTPLQLLYYWDSFYIFQKGSAFVPGLENRWRISWINIKRFQIMKHNYMIMKKEMETISKNQSNKTRINELDFLRAFAVLAVIMIHTVAKIDQIKSLNSLVFVNVFIDVASHFAVPVFIIVSGIVLSYNYYKNINYKAYYIKRFFSIIPQFLFFSLLYLILSNLYFWIREVLRF